MCQGSQLLIVLILTNSKVEPDTMSPATKGAKWNADLDLPSMPVEVVTQDLGNDGSDRETAAQVFRRSLHKAFELENEMLDTTGDLQVIDSDRISLIHSVLSNIKQQLRKVLTLSSLSQVPLEDILRLRKLCEGRLNAARMIEFRLEDSLGRETHVEERVQQVIMSCCGLLSGYICLLIGSGGRHEIKLCSGTFFQSVSDVLKNVLETCIIPALLPANRPQSFAAIEPFAALISACEQIFGLLTTLVRDIKLPETVLGTLESAALLSLYADNGAEKVGLEKVRSAALDWLVQAFHYYPNQRPGILREILIPIKKTTDSQNSHKFKLRKGGSIQVVSVLVMRIIQSAASKDNDNYSSEEITSSASALVLGTGRLRALRTAVTKPSLRKCAKKDKPIAGQALSALASSLLDIATNIAMQIMDFVVGRALSPGKIRDESYRNLLHILLEDFVKSLDCPEWPAAELLLRLLLFKMIRLLEADKTTPTVKLMAVDVLGLIGAAISSLNFNIRHPATSETRKTNLSWYPWNTMEDSLQLKPRLEDITALGGPFHAAVEFLSSQSALEQQMRGAIGYLTAQWAFTTYSSMSSDTEPKKNNRECSLLAVRLQRIMAEKVYGPRAFDLHCVAPGNAHLAYNLTLLRSQLCESFDKVLEILLLCARSPRTSIRCKSLKVLLQILEADPFIICHAPDIKTLVSGRTNDISVSVRETSLRLISRCMALKPELEVELMPDILRRTTDDSITVRKCAIKILKDIYLRQSEPNTRSGIAEALLYRTADLDRTVREAAYQSIEEIWISPYLIASSKNDSSQARLDTNSHLCFIAKIVQRDRRLSSIFTTTLQATILRPSKGSAALRVYSWFVARMFDMIDKSTAESDTSVDAATIFQLLLIFAKTNASIFTKQQINILQPYIGKIGKEDDMIVYRCAVSILYRALPLVSNVDPTLLRSIRANLIQQVTRFNRPILSEVIPCLRTISEILQDNKPLTNLTLSCLENSRNMADIQLHDPTQPEAVRRIKKLLLIAGICGRHCNFEAQLEHLKTRFQDWEGQSVSGFMIGTFSLFSSSEQPMDVRETAFDAICMVCQMWPQHFTSSVVTALFVEVFEEKNSVLEIIILQAFKEFLLAEEQNQKISNVMTAKLDHIGSSQRDGVAAFIAQRFMSNRKDVVRIALATQDDQALLATEVLASMNRQGLLHPKECTHICIALETSQNRRIADLSFSIHQILHSKYETIIEKEYMRAVDVAYEYQRDVAGNVRGATCDPYLSILHRMMEVTKTGKIKGRKKFYENLCARIDLDLSQISRLELPQYLQRSQFILENIAFFEYASTEELKAALIAMENVFTRSGVIVVDAIKSEILGRMSSVEESGQNDPNRLQMLAAFSTVLSSLWDTKTYLDQQYGISGTPKTSGDSGKAPSKVDNINGRGFWERNCLMMTKLDSEQTMLAQCRAFVELFQEDIGSSVLVRRVGGLPRTTGDKSGDKLRLRVRKRKAPEA